MRERDDEELSDVSVVESVDDLDYCSSGKYLADESDSSDGNDGDNNASVSARDHAVDITMPSVSGVGDVCDSGEARVVGLQHGSKKPRRPRTLGREEWKEAKAKRLRNLGLEYTSVSLGKKMATRKIGPPCSDGCFNNLSEETRNAIFKNFWAMGNYNKQNSYISQRKRPVPVKRKYTKKAVSSHMNYEYSVKYFNRTYVVCRKAFLSLHDISEHRLYLQVKKMKESSTGTPEGDKRGKRPNVRKTSDLYLQRMFQQIRSLPRTASHYTYANALHHRYLDVGGTYKKLYEHYLFWMREHFPTETVVNERAYHKHVRKYNKAFQQPKKDMCATAAMPRDDDIGSNSENDLMGYSTPVMSFSQ